MYRDAARSRRANGRPRLRDLLAAVPRQAKHIHTHSLAAWVASRKKGRVLLLGRSSQTQAPSPPSPSLVSPCWDVLELGPWCWPGHGRGGQARR